MRARTNHDHAAVTSARKLGDARSIRASSWLRRAAVFGLIALTGCAGPGVSELLSRPAERALMTGIRAYEEAQYKVAERDLQAALNLGLGAASDRASAHKLLAFVQCSSQRVAECEASFKAALKEHPRFTLDKSEAGNPLWGPVFRRVAGRP